MSGWDDLPPLVLPSHPSVFLVDVEALKAYLRERGVAHFVNPYGVSIQIDIGLPADFDIDVHWLQGQVRFGVVTGLEVPRDREAAVALEVEGLNARRGFPVWMLKPVLAATFTAVRNHDDTLSSRVLEYAIALLRDSLERDRPTFAKLLG